MLAAAAAVGGVTKEEEGGGTKEAEGGARDDSASDTAGGTKRCREDDHDDDDSTAEEADKKPAAAAGKKKAKKNTDPPPTDATSLVFAPLVLKPAPFFYYTDHSREQDEDPLTPVTSAGSVPTFPASEYWFLFYTDDLLVLSILHLTQYVPQFTLFAILLF